ncbi:MAG: SPOR domain-containing protein [Spirochaetaceae bacterium]|jgi:hypothetical protein|nr:SPOR domain-containing protein [Spirochaetaceae bacterium]
MKKIFFVSLAAAVFLLFTGASVWEGAAAVSGDFPEEGMYVATNAFPRNTVVDLTNLETGKTVRVIVSAGLDTPGLLALVSREAAVAVGLQSRTIGRIRMIQPSDPIAFSRFTEDHLRSGDPDYDPLAAIEGAYPGTVLPEDQEKNGDTGRSAGTDNTPPESVPAVPEPAPAVSESVPVISEPVIAAGSSGPVKEIMPEPLPLIREEPALAAREPEKDPESAWINPSGDSQPAVPAVAEDPVETTDALIPRNGPGVEPVLSDIPQEIIPAAEKEPEPPGLVSAPVLVPVPIPVPVPVPAAPGTGGAAAAATPEPAVPASPESAAGGTASGYGYTLVPAEERVPQSYGGSGSVPQIFSVPAVSDLEYGKYYLQIGAYSQVATVERELAKVNRGYPLAVQCTGSSGRPVYRILVGPVNQGESGALLKSFQSMGYKDAFVRRGN